ncbi:MAG: hypothetical protein JNJ57_09435 [Saprospiraceae bacterium]|nr:hypothetical protein [Saprospiraceae bacterium]
MMRFIFCFLLLHFLKQADAQRVVTFDPDKDVVAERALSGALELTKPVRALAFSIQEAIPQITDIDTIITLSIGKLHFLFARGKQIDQREQSFNLGILLTEVLPGKFHADQLVISCKSSGNCNECTLTPACACTRGSGSCTQNYTFSGAMKKVTVTLFD